jgi:hypothetical protein
MRNDRDLFLFFFPLSSLFSVSFPGDWSYSNDLFGVKLGGTCDLEDWKNSAVARATLVLLQRYACDGSFKVLLFVVVLVLLLLLLLLLLSHFKLISFFIKQDFFCCCCFK